MLLAVASAPCRCPCFRRSFLFGFVVVGMPVVIEVVRSFGPVSQRWCRVSLDVEYMSRYTRLHEGALGRMGEGVFQRSKWSKPMEDRTIIFAQDRSSLGVEVRLCYPEEDPQEFCSFRRHACTRWSFLLSVNSSNSHAHLWPYVG